MTQTLDVTFNSPQCGWMSIGFTAGKAEFYTTTAHAPHDDALSELLEILSSMLSDVDFERTLKWNRVPEAYDFTFRKHGALVSIEITEYPTEERVESLGENVFSFEGEARDISMAFYETFEQLHAERFEDEFLQNWRKPFPEKEFEEFREKLAAA